MRYEPTLHGCEPEITPNAAAYARCARHPQATPSSQAELDVGRRSIAVLWCRECPEDDNALARFAVPTLF